MKTETVICDECKRDLSRSECKVDFRLALSSEPIPPRSHARAALNKFPSVDHDHHFCGWTCLCTWIVRQFPGHIKVLSSAKKSGDAA